MAGAGTLDGAQESRLVGTVQEPLAGERTPAARSQDEREPEQSRQLGHASLQRHDLLPKLRLRPVRAIETDDGA